MLKIYYLIVFSILNLFWLIPSSYATLDYKEQLIRVGISTSDFKYLEYSSIRISSDNEFIISDLSLEKPLSKLSAGAVYKISVNEKGFTIADSTKTIFSGIQGPIGVVSPSGYIKLPDVLRKGKVASYRGKFEIVRAPNTSNKLSVVNVLKLDEYLKGVVPNELPVSFGFEALKAQAVAARNYAVRPREKPYDQFDICDSVMCQVYFGYGTEHPLSNKAVEETAGLLALYKGDVITALYSSASGGFTENYEYAFSDPVTKKFPAAPLPYLKGKPDDPSVGYDLSSEEAAKKYYKGSSSSYDVKSSFHRWSKTWTRQELEQVLNMNLAKLSSDRASACFVVPAFKTTSQIGILKDIRALSRGKSGKIMELQIVGTNGSWIVKKELNIRRLLTKSGSALPSANLVLDLNKDSSGNIISIQAFGAGFGHGVGMSQYGASYMASKGFTFDKILQHYYNGVAIGTSPVVLFAYEESLPIKQNFYSPSGAAVLWIQNEGVSSVKLKINGTDLKLAKEIIGRDNIKLDISSYIDQGANEIIFYPPEADLEEGLSVKMWIEIVKACNND